MESSEEGDDDHEDNNDHSDCRITREVTMMMMMISYYMNNDDDDQPAQLVWKAAVGRECKEPPLNGFKVEHLQFLRFNVGHLVLRRC